MSQELKAQIGFLLLTNRINPYWAKELLDWIVPFRIIPAEKERATLPEIDAIIISTHLQSYGILKRRNPAIENYDVVEAVRRSTEEFSAIFTLADQRDILAIANRRRKIPS